MRQPSSTRDADTSRNNWIVVGGGWEDKLGNKLQKDINPCTKTVLRVIGKCHLFPSLEIKSTLYLLYPVWRCVCLVTGMGYWVLIHIHMPASPPSHRLAAPLCTVLVVIIEWLLWMLVYLYLNYLSKFNLYKLNKVKLEGLSPNPNIKKHY